MEEQFYAEQLLMHLHEWVDSSEYIRVKHRLPAQDASLFRVLPEWRPYLPPGVTHLYSHQKIALETALQRQHLTLATPTASGKTYAMALPARLRRLSRKGATTLCIAPTRALIEQWRERLSAWDPSVFVASYTGDTPKEERARIRAEAQVVVTTPDMLHISLLPYHRGWSLFFSRLSDVIIDEAHTYKGVFGSHFALIVRRLVRIAAIYRARPTFLFGTATIGNPAEHAELLLGQEVTPITENGAPSGGRLTVLWQPPEEQSYQDEAAGLLAFFVSQGVRTILFGQARQSVERMVRTTRERLPAHLHDKVLAYRAGYSKEQRRAIERQLAEGALLGIVATSALEIGIDLGDLDVSIVAGFPGSISSFWQQIGRAGRRQRSALSILVLKQDALDQYFASHPEMLLERPAENALVNSNNPYIFPLHLLCAAHEKPLGPQDISLFGPATEEALEQLVVQGYLSQIGDTFYLNESQSPAFSVSLRQAGPRLTIHTASKKIEETDLHHAVTECHPGAIYYSQGASYEVRVLDLSENRIEVIPKNTHYYTQALIDTDIEIDHSEEQQRFSHIQLHVGPVLVTRTVHGYITKHNAYHTILDKYELKRPLAVPLETRACWMELDDETIELLEAKNYHAAGTLHAVEHAMIALLPLFVLGDRRDVGGLSIVPMHPQTKRATIFIYDGFPGGVGYCDQAFLSWKELARATLDMLTACTCASGCYSCIMSPKCGNQNRPLDKAGAIFLLQHLLHSHF
uniref:DEAD/DEAH box helicase n=1 Tax=Thermosporothrix sp. COM3 TaxID=2490863 RepID=A0A455SGR5_9CHLR|nr:hypothetical protein KTC_16870 [Thermosporothrix sp. COM3]